MNWRTIKDSMLVRFMVCMLFVGIGSWVSTDFRIWYEHQKWLTESLLELHNSQSLDPSRAARLEEGVWMAQRALDRDYPFHVYRVALIICFWGVGAVMGSLLNTAYVRAWKKKVGLDEKTAGQSPPYGPCNRDQEVP